ncbi:sulfatase-like hydrolase/transferase, partial [Nitrospinae bacterium AH_259_B05_G02_I21]|nr:sulfatase-like hydrolase/transferase [Nitrospinae bacterium AH_259_B05_G02_I21]
MDAGIAKALEIIRETELLNPWILVITTDHGPNVGFFDDKGPTKEETYHIPLIICELGQTEG